MSESARDRLIAGIGDAAKHGEISADGNGDPRMSGDSWYVLKKRIDTALAEAEARGRRQGLEEAAKAAEFHAGVADVALKYPLEPADAARIHGVTVAALLQHIHYLAAAPAETQKPEDSNAS